MRSQSSTFKPLTNLTEKTVVLRGPNTDTDQIIPGRFLKKDRTLGYGQYLFHDMRFDEQGASKDHPLNQLPDNLPKILVVEDNFGCGSSREGAVYALVDYGIRVVIGTTFGDIFHNNCFKNGVLPIRLSQQDHARLMMDLMQAGAENSDQPLPAVTVDLQVCEVRWPQGQVSFVVDAFARECLLKGLDELSLTMSYQPQIEAFETQYLAKHPWLSTQS